MKLFSLLVFLLSAAWAQEEYAFSLEGDYPVASQSFIPINVTYTIRWNETGNKIEGIYTDDYFGSEIPVTGTTTSYGRSLEAVLEDPLRGVKTINFIVTQVGQYNGQVNLTITLKNESGGPVNQTPDLGRMNSRVLNPAAEKEGCSLGFGELAGYCGQYAGTISEAIDGANKCNLLVPGVTKLVLNKDKTVRIYFNTEGNRLSGRPFHYLGLLPAVMRDSNVILKTQVCSPLPNTQFTTDSCKEINLTGAFLDQDDTPSFTGTYTIKKLETGEICSYNLNLLRDIEY
jgi:hypothetical protein